MSRLRSEPDDVHVRFDTEDRIEDADLSGGPSSGTDTQQQYRSARNKSTGQ